MKSKLVNDKESLLGSVSKALREAVRGAPLSEGPFYLVTSKRDVLIQSEALKGISAQIEGTQLVSVSQNITEEAAKEIESVGGVVVVGRDFHWTEDSVKGGA